LRGHNEGSIFRRKRTGKWTAAVSMQGRRVERQAEWHDNCRDRAKEILRELLEQRDAELDTPARKLTLAAYLRSWLADMEGRVRPSTIVVYRGACENHIIPALGSLTLDRLGPTAIQRWLDSLEYGPATIAKLRAVLRAALNTAVRRRKIVRSPMMGTESAVIPVRRAATLSAAQAGALIDGTAADELGPLWALLLASGLRISEALALTWDHFDGKAIIVRYQLARRDGQWVRVPTKAVRSVERVALPAFACDSLARLNKRTGSPTFGLCFRTPAGLPLSEQQALNALYAAEKRLGLPKVGCHGLRHSSLTILADVGVPEDVRMRRAGHSTTAMSRHYVHGAEEADRMAADALGVAIGGK
jgi:integrase